VASQLGSRLTRSSLPACPTCTPPHWFWRHRPLRHARGVVDDVVDQLSVRRRRRYRTLHCVDSRSHERLLSHHRQSGDGREGLEWLRVSSRVLDRSSLPEVTRWPRRHTGRQRRALHPVARRRTLAHRQLAHSRRLHQLDPAHHQRRPRAFGPRRCGVQQRVALRYVEKFAGRTLSPLRLSAAAPSRRSGARSTPTLWVATSNRCPSQWSPSCACGTHAAVTLGAPTGRRGVTRSARSGVLTQRSGRDLYDSRRTQFPTMYERDKKWMRRTTKSSPIH